tara:strand:- start:521 stop:1198 length:678 start_codon:yes stop_codon:yes gene_type:complete
MTLEYLKNSLNTWGKPTKYPRVYTLLEDGRHRVQWTDSKGNTAQSIYIDKEPDGTLIKCHVCKTHCLTAAVKYQRKNGDYKKRHTCTRKCQEELTRDHKYNPLVISRDEEGYYEDEKGYMVRRVRKLRESGKYKGRMHRVKEYMHRMVMQDHLGRKLLPIEQVHHIDMNKTNNHISNLWLCTPSDHMAAHHSFNECCEELMDNFHKYSDIKFDIELGQYYLCVTV